MAVVRLDRVKAQTGAYRPACLLCGGAAQIRKKERFVFEPFWYGLLGTCFWFPRVLNLLGDRKSCEIVTHYCRTHSDQKKAMRFFTWPSIIFMLLYLIKGIYAYILMKLWPEEMNVDSAGHSLQAISVLIAMNRAFMAFFGYLTTQIVFSFITLRISNLSDTMLEISGVSKKYADAIGLPPEKYAADVRSVIISTTAVTLATIILFGLVSVFTFSSWGVNTITNLQSLEPAERPVMAEKPRLTPEPPSFDHAKDIPHSPLPLEFEKAKKAQPRSFVNPENQASPEVTASSPSDEYRMGEEIQDTAGLNPREKVFVVFGDLTCLALIKKTLPGNYVMVEFEDRSLNIPRLHPVKNLRIAVRKNPTEEAPATAIAASTPPAQSSSIANDSTSAEISSGDKSEPLSEFEAARKKIEERRAALAARRNEEKPGYAVEAKQIKQGSEIFALWGASWYPARVTAVKEGKFLVHYDGWASTADEWVELGRIRLKEKPQENVSSPPKSPRIWTDATGKHKTEAELLDVVDGKVRLKKSDGTEISLPLERLSEADREFLNSR